MEEYMAYNTRTRLWSINEQIIEDASGLTLQFEVTPDGEPRLRIFGEALPFGNREIQFTPDGRHAGAGTTTTGLSRPSWMTEMTD